MKTTTMTEEQSKAHLIAEIQSLTEEEKMLVYLKILEIQSRRTKNIA